MNGSAKSLWLFLAAVAIMLVVVFHEVIPWLRRAQALGPGFFLLCVASCGAWMLILWWALCRLLFQLAALWPTRVLPLPDLPAQPVRFRVCYVTCDDFLPECCASCFDQDYPAGSFQVVICDDSATAPSRAEVDQFCATHPAILCLRRANRTGHKAGNLNRVHEALAAEPWDWSVIVDADQVLPRRFLSDLARFVAHLPAEVAFVQAGRDAFPPPGLEPTYEGALRPTPFQDALGAEVRLFFERDLCWREPCGFLPFLGHGGAIRAQAWKALGGFPQVVSEDYAFSMVARGQGWCGRRLEQMRSWEAYPKDFGAFLVRFKKFAAGAAELVRQYWPAFLRSRAHWSEKLDVTLWLGSYALLPLVAVNLPASGFISHRLWAEQLCPMSARLAYLFVAMGLLSYAVLVSVCRVPGQARRCWFWSFAVYTAALPLAAWHFVLGLLKTPFFERTPKGRSPSPSFRLAGVLTPTLGFGLLFLAVWWRSPFSPILGASGLAYAGFPLYRWLHEPLTRRGRWSRVCVWFPGLSFLVGLAAMWLWAS